MIQLILAVLLVIAAPAYAQDTEVLNVDLSSQQVAQLHKYKDARIKGVSYTPAQRRAVFVSDGPLSKSDVDSLTQGLQSFTPTDDTKEARRKELEAKSKLTADELTELLRNKGVL